MMMRSLLLLLPWPGAHVGTHAMLYLEDVAGALRYDALPPPPSSWVPPEEYPADGGEYEFRWGTPDHYLTHAPAPPTAAPSGAPSANGSLEALAGNATSDNEGQGDAAIANATTNNATQPNGTTELFDRSLEGITGAPYLSRPPLDEGTDVLPAEEGFVPSRPAWPEGRPPAAPPTASHSPTMDLMQLPTKPPSVIPEITGEATDPFHPYKPHPTPSSHTDPLYFDDLSLITHPSRNYVIYDSKQAHFGVDLGPRGNAAYVNVMLPPRWGGTEGRDGWWAGLDAAWWAGAEVGGEDAEGVGAVDANATGNGGAGMGNAMGNASALTTGMENDNPDNHSEATAGVSSSAPSLMPSSSSDVESGRVRRLQTVDEVLGLEEEASLFDVPESNPAIDESGIDNDTTVGKESFDTAMNTTANNTSLGGNEASTATESPIITTDLDGDGATGGHPSSYHVADYFCLKDFVDWRRHQRNTTNANDGASSSPMPNATSDVSSSATNGVESTRPLTLLVRRGRCSFESKARLAMMLNDLFEISGRANRIAHIVVYNNGTANPTPGGENGDTLTDQAEKLVDMTRESTLDEGGEIKVGLLYVSTQSGEDLQRRMREREITTGTSPHMEASMLFQDDGTPEEGQTLPKGQSSRTRRRMQKRRRVAHGSLDGSTTDNGDYQDSLDLDDDAFHDTSVANGWFFPATLTRFCLSCGRGMHYGLVWSNDGVSKDPSTSDGQGAGLFPPEGGTPGGGTGVPPLRPPIEWPSRYGTVDYHQRPYLEVIRKMMIAILVLLLVGPMFLAARRWHTVGGTFRITTDEHGRRRVRIVNPNLEVFVNGVPGTVETNGTKLDRSQVFSLPEVEYTGAVDTEEEEYNTDDGIDANENSLERGERSIESETVDVPQDRGALRHSSGHNSTESSSPLGITSALSRESTTSARFVSSSTCSICLDEFVIGEKVRVLPRCDHAFHTECILPWLTERQGCCPYCKAPVLPDELQRSPQRRRLRRRRRGRGLRTSHGGLQRDQPQSSVTGTSTEMEDAEAHVEGVRSIEIGVRLTPEDVESDMNSLSRQQLATPIDSLDSIPDGEGTPSPVDDLTLLEQGGPISSSIDNEGPRIRTVSLDAEDLMVAMIHNDSNRVGENSATGDDTFTTTCDEFDNNGSAGDSYGQERR